MPVRNVKFGPPKTALSNSSIKNALSTTLVPAILESCGIVAVRCAFEFCSQSEAIKQLAARRKQIELKLVEVEDVSRYIDIHIFIFTIVFGYTSNHVA